jgi:ABC-type uncharacterized transport system permease subunit
MAVLFGTDGLVNHLTLIFGALYALGGLIFRKSIANDILNMKFSFIGCLVGSILPFVILDAFVENIRILVGIGLVGWVVGGFLLGLWLPDGEADGGSEA